MVAMVAAEPDLEARLQSVTAAYDGADNEAARLTDAALARLSWRLRRGGKVCSACKAMKPVAEFRRNASRKDGLHHACRGCEKGRRESA